MSDDMTTSVIVKSGEQEPERNPEVDNSDTVASGKEISTADYTFSVLNKILESATSVKVWMWAWPFTMSTIIAYYILGHCQSPTDYINVFNGWCTFNLGLTGTVVVVREQFKVEKIKRVNVEEAKNIQD